MDNTPYRAILFDFDGTLIDNQAAYVAAFESLSQHYPQVLDPHSVEQRKKVAEFYHVDQPSVAYEQFCEFYQWENPPTFDQFWDTWTLLYIASATPFPCVIQTLERLRECGYRIGLITNGDSAFQRAKLTASKLTSYFDHIVISGEVGVEKPDPKIYQIAAQALGVSASECLFVGDTHKTDIAGAKNVGMDSMLVQNPRPSLDATYHAKDISALLEIV